MRLRVLKSCEDDSVNFVFRINEKEAFEARYVRRPEGNRRKMAIYLSSQSGCAQGCWFCHLTATAQTQYTNADSKIYLGQALKVFKYYDSIKDQDPAQMVHFNFMARGEALANPLFLDQGQQLFNRLGEEVIERNLQARFLVSTIMPISFRGKSLGKFFPVSGPEIYYSIYSVRDSFRKTMMPAAMPVKEALGMLKKYHDETKKVVRLHWSFIRDKNDSKEDVLLMCDEILSSKLIAEVRIVRYNPYGPEYGEESPWPTIERNLEMIQRYLPFSSAKVITRVGRDVKASCGMFVES